MRKCPTAPCNTQSVKMVKSLLNVLWREAQNTLQGKKVSTRDSTSPQSWPGKEMCAWRPVWLWSCVWWPWGGLGKRIRQISLFIIPFLMFLFFSVWLSLCPVAEIPMSKHKPFELILIILIIILFILMLHYYNHNTSENAHCLYSLYVHFLCLFIENYIFLEFL